MKPARRRFLHLAVGAAALPALPRITRAQSYPSRLVTIIVPFAAGGTAEGAVKLLRQLGAQVLAACFIIDLPDLGGAARLRKLDVPVRTLISFEGH